MSGHPVDFGEYDDLVDTLVAAGLRAAVDPADLNLPGVLVTLDGIDYDVLDGYTLATRLVLVVPDNGHVRSLAALATLLNQVVDVIDPAGRVTAGTTVLPGNPSPLPALSVPVNLRIT